MTAGKHKHAQVQAQIRAHIHAHIHGQMHRCSRCCTGTAPRTGTGTGTRAGTRPRLRGITRIALLCASALSQMAWAAAVTDGSMGPARSFSGQFVIPQTVGTVRGANLFHSFSRFGVATGESATFSVADPAVRNVISRVTGGSASSIDGAVRLSAPAGSQPNFLLLNPSGIVVGPAASFDVPAALHLSTMHRINFADGSSWDTRNPSTGSLTVAPITGFGFLPGQPQAAMRLQDTLIQGAPGATVELAAGALTMDGSHVYAPAGSIHVFAPGAVTMTNTSYLEAGNNSANNSGSVSMLAGRLDIDGRGKQAGIFVFAGPGQLDRPPLIDIKVSGTIRLADGAKLSAQTRASNGDGAVRIQADSMQITGGTLPASVTSTTVLGGEGPALALDVRNLLELSQGGMIKTEAFGSGRSGRIDLHAGDLLIDGRGVGTTMVSTDSTNFNGGSGAINVDVKESVQIFDGGRITAAAQGVAGAGDITVQARRLLLDEHLGKKFAAITSEGLAYAPSGTIRITAGQVDVRQGAQIQSYSESSTTGDIAIRADRMNIEGGGQLTTVLSNAYGASNNAGSVDINLSERLLVADGGLIASNSYGGGQAKRVSIKAPIVDVIGTDNTIAAIEVFRGGELSIEAGSLSLKSQAFARATAETGQAGDVRIVADQVSVNGLGNLAAMGSISVKGNAGTVDVRAASQLTLRDGAFLLNSGVGSEGQPGIIRVTTPWLLIEGGAGDSGLAGIGGAPAGDVSHAIGATVLIDATRIEMRGDSSINAMAGGIATGTAGSIRITADTLNADGSAQISAGTLGNADAGNVRIQVRDMTMSKGATVSALTAGAGHAGTISIDAGRLQLDGALTNIVAGTSNADIDKIATGNGGRIDIHTTGPLQLSGGARVVASTGSAGSAGDIRIDAASLAATGDGSGVASNAGAGSSGQVGTVDLRVRGLLTLDDGARLSIRNQAVVDDPSKLRAASLSVAAESMALTGASITAAASGNTGAGTVSVVSAGDLSMRNSAITTSATDGSGGPVAINAGHVFRLQDSRVTTSVTGRSGDGGDIGINSRFLLLESGFIQANTAAPLARGGAITIATDAVLANGGNAFIGGNRISDFRSGVVGLNVIQAAAPDGISGQLTLSDARLSVSGILVGLTTPSLGGDLLGGGMCMADGEASSLRVLGRGGLPPAATDLLLPRLR